MIPAIWAALLRAAPVRLWVLMGAGPPLTAFAAWVAWIVWRGGWLPSMQAKQLDILGWALMIVLGLIGVIVVALAAVKVSGRGPGGLGFEIDGDGDSDAVK